MKVLITLEDTDDGNVAYSVEFKRFIPPQGRLQRSVAARLWDQLEPRLRNIAHCLTLRPPSTTTPRTRSRTRSKPRSPAAPGRASKARTKT